MKPYARVVLTLMCLLLVGVVAAENQNITPDFITIIPDNTTYHANVSFHDTSLENLIVWSQNFEKDNWTKYQSTVAANTTTDPLGGTTAYSLKEATGTDTSIIRNSVASWLSSEVADNTKLTISLYAKKVSRDWIYLMGRAKNNNYYLAYFNLSDGTIGTVSAGTQAGIVPVSDGWYRIAINYSSTTGTTQMLAQIGIASADNTPTFTHVNGQTAQYIWGAQMERSQFNSTYIRTYTNQTTHPTAWQWYFGADETIGSTSQNPVQIFTPGTYNIRLNASTSNRGMAWVNKSGNVIVTPPALKDWPRVMIDFDDGLTSLSDAYDILHAYNYTANAYVNSEYVGTSSISPTYLEGYADLDNLTKFHTEGGWIIGNHGGNHTDFMTYDLAGQQQIIGNGKSWLESNGFSDGSRFVAYPYGDRNANTDLAMAATGSLLGRTTAQGPFDIPYDMSRKYNMTISTGVLNTTGASYHESNIAAKGNGQTYRILFHAINATSPVSSSWSPNNLSDLIEWMHDNGYQTITISEWYALNPQQNSPQIFNWYCPAGRFCFSPEDALPETSLFQAIVGNITTDGPLTTLNWSWGDGEWTNGTGGSPTASHLYSSVGTYQAYAIASNSSGSNQSASQDIEVIDILSIRNLTGSPPSKSEMTWSWLWGNPDPIDTILMIYRNGVFWTNSSNTTTSRTWNELPAGTNETFSSLTCHTILGCNTTWVNETVTTEGFGPDCARPTLPTEFSNTTWGETGISSVLPIFPIVGVMILLFTIGVIITVVSISKSGNVSYLVSFIAKSFIVLIVAIVMCLLILVILNGIGSVIISP